jgi:GAF domain-containing protein
VTRNSRRLPALPLADELSLVFARMSGLLLSEETVTTALGLIGSLALETVPGACGAGVTLVESRGRRRTSGATDRRVEEADRIQYELDEGPCLDATATRQVVRVDDIANDPRWPRWSARAAPLGLRTALSAPLVAGDEALGAIKVYGDAPGGFDKHAEQLLSMFAAQAAIFVANLQSFERARRVSEQLRKTVRNRDMVGMAKGMLMARDGVDEDTAFALLVARSHEDGVPLLDVARTLIESSVRRRR